MIKKKRHLKLLKILKKIKKNFQIKNSINKQFDSIQMLELIALIEKSYSIKILNKDINTSNFSKITSLQKLINANVKNKSIR